LSCNCKTINKLTNGTILSGITSCAIAVVIVNQIGTICTIFTGVGITFIDIYTGIPGDPGADSGARESQNGQKSGRRKVKGKTRNTWGYVSPE